MVTLWGLTFHAYGLIVGLAVVVAWWNLERWCQKYNQPLLNWVEWLGLLFLVVCGARSWHVLTELNWYLTMWQAGEWWQVLAIWQGGLSILGGVVGMVLGLWWLRRKHFVMWLDFVALVLPWSQAIGRLANWVNQELYGFPTTLPWGITITSVSQIQRFHPLFAYEMVATSILGFSLWRLQNKAAWKPGSGKLWWLYLGCYSVVRFLLDFLRLDRGPVWWGLGVNQWAMFTTTIISVVMLLKRSLKQVFLPMVFGVLCVIAVLLGRQFYVNQNLETVLQSQPDLSEVQLQFPSQSKPLIVTLAKTDQSRDQGLGEITALTNDGMLFWFPRSDRWQFWMKGMRFGLDFVWLNNLTIVALNQNVPAPDPFSLKPNGIVLVPPKPINFVLELPAGTVAKLDLKIGETAQLKTK